MSAGEQAGIAWGGVALPGLDEDRVALVTGGTGAIGWRTVEVLATLGVRVGVMARASTKVQEAIDAAPVAIRDRLLNVPGDVAVQRDDVACVESVVARWGRLDILVHAAALGDSGASLEDLTVDEIDKLLAVNVKGTLLIAQAAATQMRTQRHGSVVLVGSVGAFRAAPGGNVYGATKAAVVRLARQLAVELGPDGIRVNCVSPGQTPTVLRRVGEQPGTPQRSARGGNEADIPLGRRGRLDDYAGAIAFLASDLAAYITGTDLLVDGGVAIRR